MRCLYVASEVAGFAKTGGLADVAAALPRALVERGLECAVAMPLYGSIRRGSEPLCDTRCPFRIAMGERQIAGGVWRATLPGTHIPVFLIEQPEFFERDEPGRSAGIYQFIQPDGSVTDYPDNALRFGFFCRAVLEALPLVDFWPEVMHINDWQTGLIPVYLREFYRRHAQPELRARYAAIRTLCTVHNLAYQGLFDPACLPVLGLPWRLFHLDALEFYGRVNFLKAALVFADLLTTVSPTYAREIRTPYFGCGLQGVLLERSAQLTGIVNGVDYRIWNPSTDPYLPVRYDEQSVTEGKAKCKAYLQHRLGVEENPQVPVLGMVSRLAEQKGLDLVALVAAALVDELKVQLVVLGQGDSRYHQMLTDLRRKFPRQVGIHLIQDEQLAHQIEAGADMFLMPSQYEPCGLSQLYSLKYGTVPIVRATGGLADTVTDASEANLAAGTATGFSFVTYARDELLGTITRAATMYRQQPPRWRELQRTGMSQDWSWNRSALEYERLYRAAVASM